jgi:aspartate/methionine/tyrosine aminotransferase
MHRDLFNWAAPLGETVVFPWLRDERNARPMCQLLAEHGVLVLPGDCFGVPDHFRVGFGTQANGFAEALEIATRALTSR